jgi:hypothetical protein
MFAAAVGVTGLSLYKGRTPQAAPALRPAQ